MQFLKAARVGRAGAARNAAAGAGAASRELETAHRRLINLHLEKELKSARVLREMRHARCSPSPLQWSRCSNSSSSCPSSGPRAAVSCSSRSTSRWAPGTMHPETFLRVLGPTHWNVAYVQPSRRPADGRFGENPNRLFKHQQFQVILKPAPDEVQQLYLQSLEACGIDLRAHDVRFEEDNWESPTLGAWGIGWQVLFDGQEITQFTYFQQAGGIDLSPISVELTYGIERLAMALQDVDNVYDVEWAPGVKYRDVRHRDEVEQSKYAFGQIDMPKAELHALHRDSVRPVLRARRRRCCARTWCCRRSTTA